MNWHKLIRKAYYKAYSSVPRRGLQPSSEPIDVIIPVLQKDLRILPLCIEGVRHCVMNAIKDIYIVAPHDEVIISYCRENGLVYVDESEVFSFTPKELNLKVRTGREGRERDRSGWLFQQFIKLSGRIGACSNYLCIDSDHVLIRPHVFVTDSGQPVFYKSREYHKPYTDNISKLIGIRQFSFLSFVAHKMCFNKDRIEELHKLLESNAGGRTWTQVVLDSYDRTQVSGFSEFQLYGHFVKEKIERPWLAHSLRYGKIRPYDELRRRYSRRYASLTFPDYKNK